MTVSYNTQPNSPFFSLPRELRDIIYDYLFRRTRHRLRIANLRLFIYYDPQYEFSPTHPPTWLMTCKQMLLEAGDQFHRHATFGCDPYCIADPGKLRLWTCVPGKTCGSRQLSPIDELPEPMIPLSPLPLPTTFPILDTEPDSTFGPGRYAEPEIDASWETRSDADSGYESGTEAEIVAGEDLKTSSSSEPDSIPIQEVDLASQEEENVDSGYASGSDSPHSAINTDSPPRPAVNLRELADRLVAIHSQQNSPSHSTTTTIPSALSIFNPILIRRLSLTDINLRIALHPFSPSYLPHHPNSQNQCQYPSHIPPHLSFDHKSFPNLHVLQSEYSCLETIELKMRRQFEGYSCSWMRLMPFNDFVALLSDRGLVAFDGSGRATWEAPWVVDTSWLENFKPCNRLREIRLLVHKDRDDLFPVWAFPAVAGAGEEWETGWEQDTFVQRRNGNRDEWLRKGLQHAEFRFVDAARTVLGLDLDQGSGGGDEGDGQQIHSAAPDVAWFEEADIDGTQGVEELDGRQLEELRWEGEWVDEGKGVVVKKFVDWEGEEWVGKWLDGWQGVSVCKVDVEDSHA